MQSIQANLDKLREYDALFASDDAFIPFRDIAASLIASATFALETEAVRLDTVAVTVAETGEDQMQRLSILAHYPALTPEFAQILFERAAVNGEMGSIRMLRELGHTNLAFEIAVKNGHVHIVRELLLFPPDSLDLGVCFTYARTFEMLTFLFQEIRKRSNLLGEAWYYLKQTQPLFILSSFSDAVRTQNIPKLTFFASNWGHMFEVEHFIDCCRTKNDQMIIALCKTLPNYYLMHFMHTAIKHGFTAAVRYLRARISSLCTIRRHYRCNQIT
jgi:hypothetical protein